MQIQFATAGRSPVQGGRLMTRRFSPSRSAALLLACGLVFLLAGDRGVTAVVDGIDPLEVLNLQVKPNVIVALDTSGSMEDLTNNNNSNYGGDHIRSKMWQAKQVLKAVFQANQDKASFMFATYRYSSAADPRGNMTVGSLSGTGTPNRFVYSAQSWGAGTFPNPACTVDPTTCPSPNPATVTLPVQGPSPSMVTNNLVVNSLYAYQWIQNSANIVNNTLVFNETGGPTCTVQVTPKFYIDGNALALAIQNAMNSCGGIGNSYSVWFGTSQSITLTSLASGGTTTATANTATPHGFATGDTVTIAGATPNGYNGSKTVTVVNPTRFTYTVAAGLANATGTITASRAAGTANRFSFRGSGVRTFTLQWSAAATTLAGPMNQSGNTSVTGTNTWTSADPRINLLRRTAGQVFNETFDPDGASTTLTPALDKPSPSRPVVTYNLDAGKYWNGETVYVDSSGNACDITVGAPTNPPTVTLELTTNCASGAASADPTKTGVFTWGGGTVRSGSGSCQGMASQVALVPCNQLTPPQYDSIAPFLENQVPLLATGAVSGYTERNDGSGYVTSQPNLGGVIASGNTPLAQTINDVATLFRSLWSTGVQAVTPIAPATFPALPGGGIVTHLNPKEKTIFILVTDGLQTCSPFTGGSGSIGSAPYNPTSMTGDDAASLGTAAAAQKLYNPDSVANKGNGANAGNVNPDGTINGDPAASVTTYVVTYGSGAAKTESDWIAWGGSGMKRALGTYSGQDTWTTIPTQAERDACTTCVDSFQAPDADTLADVLTKVINQGASSGEFSAQQSLTDSIFELAGDVPQGTAPAPWSPFNPRNRYDPLVPHRIVSTFTLPLFTGQIKAYTQGGPATLSSTGADCAYTVVNNVLTGNACRRWSANDKLADRVSVGMGAACVADATAGVTGGQCTFTKLWNGADYTNVGTLAGVGIRRRIFTTSQNGVFGPTVDQLIAGQSPFRVALWPPQTSGVATAVAPANDTGTGLFDAELGLPLDSASPIDAAFLNLRNTFRACKGTNLPAACPPTTQTSGFTLAQMQRARRETREMLLSFLAGASYLADAAGDPKRVAATSGGYTASDMLFTARTSILAESTLATPAVVAPPQEELPEATAWKPEYVLYRDGPRDHTDPTLEPDGRSTFDGVMVRSGFGLRNPDRDGTNQTNGTVQGRVFYQNDARVMKPVMSVLYTGSNLALHAFRAGTSIATDITTACDTSAPAMTALHDQEARGQGRNCGGEELWAFVPYDQLGKIQNRYIHNPQKRDPHDYVIARAIRFSDVFVPNPGTASDPDGTSVAKTVGGVSLGQVAGVWRKVLFVGRGKGGKYLTAIDVTAPGMFTDLALSNNIVGPIVLWNRGNPDTTNGTPGGTKVHDQSDYDAYLTMGETWSVPAVAFVDRATMRADDPTKKATATARKPTGVDFVMYAGSGYGNTGEGTSFYSLDPLTGDVITSVDVDTFATANYPTLARSGMPYADAIVANPVVFNASRYLYAPGGVASPNVAAAAARRVYVADLWGRQWKFLTAAPDKPLPVADLGADQPVATANSLIGLPANDPNTKPYLYTTSGNDTRATGTFHNFGFRDDGSDTSLSVLSAVSQNGINVFPPMVSLFVIPFEPEFRGTVQPSTAFSDTAGSTGNGRVFFGGTRFNGPNSPYAPPVPPYPCRSSFDSIIYALGAESGLAAYNLAYGNNYVIFQDSRIVAISTQAAPGASLLAKDEGLSKTGQPVQPPPPMGLSPATQATQNVVMVSGPGLPQPAVRFGSTVCQ
jgi:hypothetical protein